MASHSLEGEAGSVSRAHLIFMTGGARSGKSRFALELAEGGPFRKRLFVATGVACDSEMKARIARHRKAREGRFGARHHSGKGGWHLLEEPIDLPERLPKRLLTPGSFILVDCLATFLTNLLLAKNSAPQIHRKIDALLTTCRRPGVTAVFVSNEVGLGLVPEYPLGRRFRDVLGAVNQKVAEAADEVYFLVAGIPMRLR